MSKNMSILSCHHIGFEFLDKFVSDFESCLCAVLKIATSASEYEKYTFKSGGGGGLFAIKTNNLSKKLMIVK